MSESILELEWGEPGGDPVPPGMYLNSEFLGVERVPPSTDGKMPEALRWLFRVSEGEHQGKRTSCIGKIKPTETEASGRLLNSMGVSFGKPGDRVSIKDLIGRKYSVVVGLSKNNRPIVVFAYPVKA